MTIITKRIIINAVLSAALAVFTLSGANASDNLTSEAAQAVVQPFYDYLSGKVDSSEAFVNMAADWKSYSSDTEFRGIEETRAAIDGLRTHVVPDLAWAIHEVIVSEDFVVVRGEGSGTPANDFFGVPASGKRFSIMSIDVHRVIDGAVVTTWHVENWADAIRQLSSE